jgi:ADP-ribose pyrophosphatase YjhB (NUDIX family)
MLPSLPQDIQNELAQLAQRYGQPLVRTVDLTASKRFDPLSKTDRYGEVCMVIRRKNDRLLTMSKTFYPPNAYRLPTGGINYGEAIFDALLRETQEETGLEVAVRRFLAVAAYRITGLDEQPSFYTFAFLLDELGGSPQAADEDEQIEDFREILPQDLPALASTLAQLGSEDSDAIGGRWSDWGLFRAAIHYLVWEALKS